MLDVAKDTTEVVSDVLDVRTAESVLLWELGMTTRKLDLVPETPAPVLCFVMDFGTNPGEVLSDMVGEGC